jgi:hypothetical protein
MWGEFAFSLVTLWLLLTVVAQFDATEKFVGKIDPLQILPRWTFFAPNPGVTDYHLVARLKDKSGAIGMWMAVPMNAPRSRFSFFWNPRNRASKVLNDAAQSLGILRAEDQFGEHGLPLCLPYLVLLHYVDAKVCQGRSGVEVQFAVVESTGHFERNLEVAYLSRFHPVTA